jgi:hypothetical protein
MAFSKLYAFCSCMEGMDCMRWTPKWHIFEVRSFFCMLSFTRTYASSFPWRSIWKVKVPLRISFFVWIATLGKILTLDNLREISIILVGWCCMCKYSVESANHLLLHCEVAQALWSVLFSLFDVTWVMSKEMAELLACWCGQQGNILVEEVWQIAPLCLMWIIWRERNARFFMITKGQWKSPKSYLFKLCSIGPTLSVCLSFPPCLNFYLYVPLFNFSGAFLCMHHVY